MRAIERIQAKIENTEIVFSGRQKASVREELRAASCSKRRISRSPSNEPRRHSKGDGKEILKGKDPQVPVRQESQTSQ